MRLMTHESDFSLQKSVYDDDDVIVSEQIRQSRESAESTFRDRLQRQRRDADHPGTREALRH